MIIIILPAIVLILLISCENQSIVRFTKPQPSGTISLTGFPLEIQGNYVHADQSQVLTITQKCLIRNFDLHIFLHKDSLEYPYKLKEDMLINTETGEKEKVALKNGTVYWHFISSKDTLFQIGRHRVLKKFKGYYFLNTREVDSSWLVQSLSLTEGKLAIGGISDSMEIANLRTITRAGADTITYNFKPARKQFKKFVKQGGFTGLDTFYRKGIKMDDRDRREMNISPPVTSAL